MSGFRSRSLAILAVLISCAALVAVPSPVVAQFYSDSYKFLKAVRERDGTTATELLNDDKSRVVNTRNRDSGETALMIVIKRHDESWTKFLLGKGANLSLTDNAGYTALLHAAVVGFVEGAEILLERGAQVNKANSRGETPLIIAVQRRNRAMVRLLMENGADPDITDHIAGLSARDYAERNDRTGAMLELIDSEAKKNPQAKKPVFGPQ